MRPLFLILFFCFSCLCFGQDSLLAGSPVKIIDSTLKTIGPMGADTLTADSASPVSNTPALRNKKPEKKLKSKKVKVKPLVTPEADSSAAAAAGNIKALVITGILIIAGIGALFLLRSTWPDAKHLTKDDEFISDYLSRKFLPRREYYNNVYLKSDAWKRKRYVVLRRDNWRCVYCGGRATEVHHTRYARRNIGKEPIEWLVSVCRSCHEGKH